LGLLRRKGISGIAIYVLSYKRVCKSLQLSLKNSIYPYKC
jgi:hypothetical protein